ncbi:M20 family metallopeptidase [Natrialba swarupiae]|uniref:M20 family metallopeptidase n=1 Tax=Natrialba swarupiae TaxID=2448032 RepID=A0A5D5AM47_9EURY|nr:M20/M25/M40 family metallo-hydrolase [Natrialba swarupiae]TYT61947.1 M20 family metallopeptidase [Natrialba swarupiae]
MSSSVAELTRELVAIPSHDDETAAGDAIERWLREETTAHVTRDAVGNVLARKRADGSPRDEPAPRDESDDRRSLAFVGHHDVVSPADSQIRDAPEPGEYVVEERDGRIYGRGAADMKGAVAAAMVAFREATPAERADLVFASFVGEEVGGVGARHAIEEGFLPDYAVVGEGSTNYSSPGVTDVVVAHRGRRGVTVTAHGVASHASEPEAGENAIYRAAEAVERVRDLEFPSVEVAGETLAGSVAVTEIDGGSAINVVPDRCSFTVDERTVPGERADLEILADVPGLEWTVDQDLPPMQCDDDAFAEATLEAARESQSGKPELVTKPHATDAGWLSQAGTECVIVGPSEPGEAHTRDESVSIAVLERCRETYRTIAESWPA